MITLWIEPIGGISGDMFLAAGADLGLDLRELSSLLKAAGLTGFQILSRREARGGIEGARVDVELEVAPGGARPGHGRGWREIQALLRHPALRGPVSDIATRIFSRLARVEAKIHGVPEEEVHFHEVGAIDSIVDIVGAAWILDRLNVSRVLSAPPPLGSGLSKSEHGPIPIPAPATLAVMVGLPVLWEGIGELTTPTGAAILAECARFESPRLFTPERVGYGVGHATWPDRPNLLRVSLGAEATTTSAPRPIGLLEANLDDASPQLLGFLVERLLEEGALDASLGPLMMKKHRPGQRLTVVCHSVDREKLADLILRESTSLGVRWNEVERVELDRRFETVETEYGRVRIKLGLRRGEVWNVAPEYDDCAVLARERGVPLKLVLGAAAAAGQRLLSRK